MAVLGFIALLLLGTAGAMWIYSHHADLAGSGATRDGGLVSNGSRGSGNGLFVERDSAVEMPTIYITNIEQDMMRLVLEDPVGHRYEATSTSGQTATLHVPAGSYRVTVFSDNPAVQPNSGDAIFRKHKEYEASFAYSQTAEPLHLGDH